MLMNFSCFLIVIILPADFENALSGFFKEFFQEYYQCGSLEDWKNAADTFCISGAIEK